MGRKRKGSYGWAAFAIGVVACVVAGAAVGVALARQGNGSAAPSGRAGSAGPAGESALAHRPEIVLGDPAAPVELVEFADLQCPICKTNMEEVLPRVIAGPIASGEAKLSFRNFVIIGPESAPAGAAALAAAAQGRGWRFVELFYRRQRLEASGYVTARFMTAIARAAGVGNIRRWNRDRLAPATRRAVRATTREAERLGLPGAPSFAVRGPATNGLRLLGTPSGAAALTRAIRQAEGPA